MVPRQLTFLKTSIPGQKQKQKQNKRKQTNRLRAEWKPAATAGVTPHFSLPGRTRGQLSRTCAPRDDLGSGAKRRRCRAGEKPPAKCATWRCRASRSPRSRARGALRAFGAAPPPEEASPQPHLSPQPPLPPPSREPPGRLRSPRSGSMERREPARRRPRWRPQSGSASTCGARPRAAAVAPAAASRATSANSWPAGRRYRACGLGLARRSGRRGARSGERPDVGGVTVGTAPPTQRLEAKCGKAGEVAP